MTEVASVEFESLPLAVVTRFVERALLLEEGERRLEVLNRSLTASLKELEAVEDKALALFLAAQLGAHNYAARERVGAFGAFSKTV